MAKFTKSGITVTNPVWMADFTGDHLLRAPALLDATAWTATDAVVATVGAAGAAIGATSIPVAALSGAIPSGAILNFGTLPGGTVTINDGSISAGDTSITVVALPVALPAGTYLNFTGGTNAQVVQLSAAAAAAATAITVFPVDGTIANSATAPYYGGTKQARLTAAAATGATALTVDELQFALVQDDAATYSGSGSKLKSVPSGTLVGRTLAEQAASAPWGPAAIGDIPPLGEVMFTYHDVPDLDRAADVALVKPGTTIKYNKLPVQPGGVSYANLPANMLTYLRTYYRMILGAA
jgi:hypothetical protein